MSTPTKAAPERLASAAALLLGEHWQRSLARLLEVDDRLVRRWATGERPVPPWVFQRLTKHLSEQRGKVSDTLDDLATVSVVNHHEWTDSGKRYCVEPNYKKNGATLYVDEDPPCEGGDLAREVLRLSNENVRIKQILGFSECLCLHLYRAGDFQGRLFEGKVAEHDRRCPKRRAAVILGEEA